jgi:outer membrane biosynthesis protein TonB
VRLWHVFLTNALKLGPALSSVSREGGRESLLETTKANPMLKNQIHRSLPTSPTQQSIIRLSGALRRTGLAIATIAALWSIPALSPAAGLHPMVVVGIPVDNVTLKHPTPEYPRVALSLHISGNVQVTVRVENGEIKESTADSTSSMLRESALRWVTYQWKFKPTVSGVFTIPISYKESA